MVISILESVLEAKPKNKEELRIVLDNMNFVLFNRLFSAYDGEEPYFIIMYIFYAYSERSPFLILNAENMELKYSITRRLNMPEYLTGKVVYNKEILIRSCIVDYLSYQNHTDFKHLHMKELMYNYLMETTVKAMDSKKSVEIDYEDDEDAPPVVQTATNMKETLDALKQMDKLYDEIQALRKKFEDKYEYARINELDVLAAGDVNRNYGSAALESSPYIT